MSRRSDKARGQALLGTLLVVSVALTAALAAAALRPTAGRVEVRAAAISLAALFRSMSLDAVVEGRARGIEFSPGIDAEPIVFVEDREGDGITRASIDAGLERAAVPHRIARDHPGVRVGLPAGVDIAAIPPSTRRIGADDGPVRFGSARLLLFSPEGHASPGTMFLHGREGDVCAVVVFGPTARVRVWCHDRGTDRWRQM